MTVSEAIVLAGGLGTRLQEVLRGMPKPMAPVAGRPFLEYLLDYLSGEGICRVILSVGYQHDIIQSHFGDSYRGLALAYSVEESPLGTGGGLAAALQHCQGNKVFVVNGDTYFPVALSRLRQCFTLHRAHLAIALHRAKDTSRYGTLLLNDKGRIVQFLEKTETPTSPLINGGIYLAGRRLFDGTGLPEKFSFEKEFLEPFASRKRFFAMVSDAPFIDIGIPETYRQAAAILKETRKTADDDA